MTPTLHQSATAVACANIALVKYWGKRSISSADGLNLPATGSLSITLRDLRTTTTVTPQTGRASDVFLLNGVSQNDPRIEVFCEAVRQALGQPDLFFKVDSQNHFPTAAGLASSASGFAALVMAMNEAAGLGLDEAGRSQWARRGSGSAPRSLYGGFVMMHRGVLEDGQDAIAEPLMAPEAWPLEVVIAITDRDPKSVSSRLGMIQTMETSPYYPAWIEHNEQRLSVAREAVMRRDFEALSTLAEASALQMHASALAAEPGVLYWRGATVEAMHRIRALRAQGQGVFFTIDAGPQLKAVCLPEAADEVAEALADISGVSEVLRSGLGPGAHLL